MGLVSETTQVCQKLDHTLSGWVSQNFFSALKALFGCLCHSTLYHHASVGRSLGSKQHRQFDTPSTTWYARICCFVGGSGILTPNMLIYHFDLRNWDDYPWSLNLIMPYWGGTVDGRDPAPVDRLFIPYIQSFVHPRWLAGFLNHQQ